MGTNGNGLGRRSWVGVRRTTNGCGDGVVMGVVLEQVLVKWEGIVSCTCGLSDNSYVSG